MMVGNRERGLCGRMLVNLGILGEVQIFHPHATSLHSGGHVFFEINA